MRWKKLIVVRHGETWDDVTLAPPGVERGKALGPLLKKHKVGKVKVCATMLHRAREMAELIAQGLGVTVDAPNPNLTFTWDFQPEFMPDADTLVFVGHLPHIQKTPEFVKQQCGVETSIPKITRDKIPPGAAVIVDCRTGKTVLL